MGRDPAFTVVMTAVVAALVIVVGIFLTPLALIGVPAFVGYRLWVQSPKRAERLAREETETLMAQVRARSVVLSEREIEAALGDALPPRTPAALRLQLIAVGKAIFAAEGISPDVPPPPALLNTVEGARYRDMLIRAGQAAVDRTMSLSALATISDALAVIARVVPPLEGDLLVPVGQFLEHPGRTVAEVIAPFFAANDYNPFRKLRARLDANLAATHRSSPVFPEDWKGEDVVGTYLGGTPLEALFAVKTSAM